MHTLVFLEPGHFHAALTLRERHPLVRDEIVVYAREEPGDGPVGPDGSAPAREVAEFLRLVDAFNRRPARPTAWRVTVSAGDRPLDRLVDDRPGDLVVLAGRNDAKAERMRRLHDAGFHVLADKPWITRAEALADLRHALSGGAVAMEIMTSRHEITAVLAERLVREPEIFGDFRAGDGEPAIRLESVHHLEKTVNGAPLRRPPWYFDVRIQGDGVADIPTHLVDQAQRLLAGHRTPVERRAELLEARRWSTPVPRDLFQRVTGLAEFPERLRDVIDGDVLAYQANAELSFRLRGVRVDVACRWALSTPPGGGDAHHAVVRGTRADIRIEDTGQPGGRRRLTVVAHDGTGGVAEALAATITAWGDEFPGLAATAVPLGLELEIPAGLRTGHESHFPLVLDEALQTIDRGRWPDARAADTLAKYELLGAALARVARHATAVVRGRVEDRTSASGRPVRARPESERR